MARLFLPVLHTTHALLIAQMAWQFSCASSQCTDEICPEEGESAQSLLQMRKHDLAKTELGSEYDKCTQMSLNSAESQILYAWTTDATRPYNVRPTNRLFQLCQEAIESIPTSINSVSLIKGDDLVSWDESQSLALGIKGSYGAFRASADGKVGSSSSGTTKKQHRKHNNWWAKKKVHWTSTNLHKFLTQEAKDALTNGHPEDIVRNYGEFYATEVLVGGLLSVDYELEYQSSKSTFSVDANFNAEYGMSGFSIQGSASGSKKTSRMSDGTSVTEEWSSYGGDSSIWAKLKTDLSNKAEIQQEWAQSLNDATMMPSKMQLSPIWFLAGNYDKRNEIKNFLQNKWKMKPGPVQVLRYAQGHIKSTMDACTLVNQKNGCWNLNDLGNGCNQMDDRCLKDGPRCNTGDIILPPGIKVETYLLYWGSNWDNACHADGWYIKHDQSFSTAGWHQTLKKPCAYKFSISDPQNYACR